jgi:thiamine-phosphate pyrophosphorylase
MNAGSPTPIARLMLVTPPLEAAGGFDASLTEAMDPAEIAAVLMRLSDGAEREQINVIKTLAKIVQSRDGALILDNAPELAARSGADGAHLTGIEAFEQCVDSLKPDRIAGAGGLMSRHDAMLAAERNADYVMFGEPEADGRRPAIDSIVERVEWWSEVFQTPCVAYAAQIEEIELLVKAGADFVALDPAIWTARPRAAIFDAAARLQLLERTE